MFKACGKSYCEILSQDIWQWQHGTASLQVVEIFEFRRMAVSKDLSQFLRLLNHFLEWI